jgi:hypothetical protein
MARVALVRGETRGIGAAVSKLFNVSRQLIEGIRARKFGRIIEMSLQSERPVRAGQLFGGEGR